MPSSRSSGSSSRPCSSRQEIAQVGTISANGDASIGEMIANAMEKVGDNGVIKTEDGRGTTNELEVVEGMQFDRGFLSPYFMTDPERQRVVLEDAYVLVHDRTISTIRDLIPLLERISGEGRPLLRDRRGRDRRGAGDARDQFDPRRAEDLCRQGAGIRRPAPRDAAGHRDPDGGYGVSEETGAKLENVALTDLGRVRRIEIDKDNTTLIGSAGTAEQIDARIAQIRKAADEATSDYEREQFEERAARLAGGVALIKVGASTETEMKEKKSRVEDALHATRAAVAEGIGAGGGVALLRARRTLDALRFGALGQDAGVKIVRRALEEPLRQIVANAGGEPSVVLGKVMARGSGHSDTTRRPTPMAT